MTVSTNYAVSGTPLSNTNSEFIESILSGYILPSGGDDAPILNALFLQNNNQLKLGPGEFKINSPLNLVCGNEFNENAYFEGAGFDKTTLLVDEAAFVTCTFGTTGANWLTAIPAIRIFSPRGGTVIRGFTIRRSAAGSSEIATTQTGLALLLDIAPDDPRQQAGQYYNQEPTYFEDVRIEGFHVGLAGSDITSLNFRACVWWLCAFEVATGFNCDIWSFDACRFGTGTGALFGRLPPVFCASNAYTGRGNEVYSVTITAGVGSVTGTNAFTAGQQVVLPVTAATGSPALVTGVRTILSATAGAFTFSATGFTGTATITMGPHNAVGSGNQWTIKDAWIYGHYRLFDNITPGSACTPPVGVKLINTYFEQFGILGFLQATIDIDFDSCFFESLMSWAQIMAAFGDANQHHAMLRLNTSGSSTPPCKVKFRKCRGTFVTDGVVWSDPDGADHVAPYIEFDDSTMKFSDAARAAYNYHLACTNNGAGGVSRILLQGQYQKAIVAGLTGEFQALGMHRFRGAVRMASSDPQVYAVSSNAASNVPAIPATLRVIPPQANIYLLEGIDKAVAINKPEIIAQNSTSTYYDYTTAQLIVNGGTRSRIMSFTGTRVKFILKEDGTAGHAITWDALYKFRVAYVQSIVTADANKTTVVEFDWDGTNWVSIGPANTWL